MASYEEEYFEEEDIVPPKKIEEKDQTKIDDEERIKKLNFNMQEMKLSYEKESNLDKLITIYHEILDSEAKLGLTLFKNYIPLKEFIRIRKFRKRMTWISFLFFIVKIYKNNC